jgi:hypothetical protein
MRAIVRRARGTAYAGIVLPPAAVPAIGATVFGGTGVALLIAGLSDVMLPGLWGRGLWFVDAGVALVVALIYAVVFAGAVLAGPGTTGGSTSAPAAR